MRTEAYGKHLLHHYGNGAILHVHLGLYGKFSTGRGEPPEPRGALRLRLANSEAWTDLRGATACELVHPRPGRRAAGSTRPRPAQPEG